MSHFYRFQNADNSRWWEYDGLDDGSWIRRSHDSPDLVRCALPGYLQIFGQDLHVIEGKLNAEAIPYPKYISSNKDVYTFDYLEGHGWMIKCVAPSGQTLYGQIGSSPIHTRQATIDTKTSTTKRKLIRSVSH